MPRITAADAQKLLDAATPGPWIVDERIRCLGVVAPALVDSPGLGQDYPGAIAFWCGWASTDDPSGPWDDVRRSSHAANASLIAAAPDIAASLIECERERDALRIERDRLAAGCAILDGDALRVDVPTPFHPPSDDAPQGDTR